MVDSLEKTTRREFLKTFGKGFLHLSAIVGINVVAGLITAKPVLNKRKKRLEENEKILSDIDKNGQELQVRYFADKIYRSSININETNTPLLGMIGGFYAMDVGGQMISKKFKWRDPIVGATSFLAGKIIDLYSTYVAANVLEDSRIKEYGLDIYFIEMNPLFSNNPSRAEILAKGSVISLICGFAGFWNPWMGRGYLGASPFISKNNHEVKDNIVYALLIGDAVKDKIKKGYNQKHIESFLETARPIDLVGYIGKPF